MNYKSILITVGLAVSLGFYFSNKTTTHTNVTLPANEKVEPAKVVPVPSTNDRGVERLNIPESAVVYLTGPIMENASLVVEEIKRKSRSGSDLYLLIDSPGGSVLDGAQIISAMEASPAHIDTVCLSLCASMAFIIHQFGHSRLAVDRAMLMAHPASGALQGTLEQMNSRLSSITRYVNKMDANIAKRAGMSLEAFKALTVSEMWIDSEDALAQGFLDKIVDVTTDAKPAPVSVLALPQQTNEKDKINLNW